MPGGLRGRALGAASWYASTFFLFPSRELSLPLSVCFLRVGKFELPVEDPDSVYCGGDLQLQPIKEVSLVGFASTFGWIGPC
jgi:hypothetical protein